MYSKSAKTIVIILAAVTVFVVVAVSKVLVNDSEKRYAGVPATAVKQQQTPMAEPVASVVPVEEAVVATTQEDVVETETPAGEPATEMGTEAVVAPTVENVTQAVETAVSTTQEASQAVAAQVETVQAEATTDLYSVVDGNKLDAVSYKGFKLFRNWCARCHGTYGQGMVGPNLSESLKILTKDQFVHTVTNGKTGQIGSMPSWKANATVMAGLDNLYAYLKARADGAIGEVKPAKQ